MGFTLHRGDQLVSIGWHSWGQILDAAKRHGWIPAGTESPIAYELNDGQTVTADDAWAFADALQVALDAGSVEPFDGRVAELIALCRGGAFTIS